MTIGLLKSSLPPTGGKSPGGGARGELLLLDDGLA